MDNIKNDDYYKRLVLEDICRIMNYTKGITNYDEFIEYDYLVDAVLFRLIQMIENVKKLSDEFRKNHPEIKWNEIVGFRNKIVHDYIQTDYSIVYEIVSDSIIKLKEELQK